MKGNGKNPTKNPSRGVGHNPTLTPGNPGNRGGKPGRSGRKRMEFVEQCAALTDSAVLTRVRAYLKDAKNKPSDPAWRWCAEYVTNYGKGRPPQEVQHTGKDGEELKVRHTIAFGDTEIAF